jgi:hypothetical protein
MIKKIFSGALILSGLCLSTFAQNSPSYINLGTTVTNIAASTTNTTAGNIIVLPPNLSAARVYVKAEGNAATTNAGASTVSNLVVHLSTASGSGTTNVFDTGILSNAKITVPALGSSTNVMSDWFQLSGVRYIRVGAIENNNIGSVSNLQVIISYP